jgi:hypothetical protein
VDGVNLKPTFDYDAAVEQMKAHLVGFANRMAPRIMYCEDPAMFVDEGESVSMRLIGGETLLDREQVEQLRDALDRWLLRRMVDDALRERLGDDGK